MTVVIFGGTAQARQLAEQLVGDGVDVVTTLAGATDKPRALPGRTRVGGFGSDKATLTWLREIGAAAVIDATHPFASQMTTRAAWLATQGVDVLRLQRPGWEGHPHSDSWHWVETHEQAADATCGTVLLTVGRQELAAYRGLPDVVARMVSAPENPPEHWQVILARGPFTVDSETALMKAHGVETLVTKDAGGSTAKLDAAAELGIDVVMIRRPRIPAGLAAVADVDAALAWVRGRM